MKYSRSSAFLDAASTSVGRPRRNIDRILAEQRFLLDALSRALQHAGEKPASPEEAKAFAASYSGASCGTVGCLVAHDVKTGRRVVRVHDASVAFSPFPEGLVDELLDGELGGVMLQCAGGLMVAGGVRPRRAL